MTKLGIFLETTKDFGKMMCHNLKFNDNQSNNIIVIGVVDSQQMNFVFRIVQK